jgi:FAD/FMN-containing dehydrogenase
VRHSTFVVDELAALADAIEGDLLLPDSPGYGIVRAPAFAQYAAVTPELVVRCKTPADIVEAIAFARRRRLELAVRAGGHSFAGRSSTRGLLVDVSPMNQVILEDGIATIGAGALLGEIYDRLEADGRTIAAGACPTVGVAGLTLGGGLGSLGRTYGLTADQLLEAEIVLADGRVVVSNEHERDDLFWALRGAGSEGFGVVTSFVFKTVPAHPLTCFLLRWPYTQATALIDAWQSWAPEAPDELAASLLLNASADVSEAPLVTVFGAMIAEDDETETALDELVVRADAEPSSSTFEHLPSGAAKRYLAEHAPGAEQSMVTTAPFMFSKSEFFRRAIPREAVKALVEHFVKDRTAGQARELDFTPWGGAYNRVEAAATAFAHRSERFLLKHAVLLDDDAEPDDQATARAWLEQSWKLVHPWGSGAVFPNFADAELADPARAYFGANRERVARIRAEFAV